MIETLLSLMTFTQHFYFAAEIEASKFLLN